MKEAEIKSRVSAFLMATSRWVVIPAALAATLGGGCDTGGTKYGAGFSPGEAGPDGTLSRCIAIDGGQGFVCPPDGAGEG